MAESAFKKMMEDFQQKTMSFQEKKIGTCFSANSENVNSFTSCITKNIELMESLEKKIGGIMLFSQLKTENCMKSGKDNDFCMNQSYKFVEEKLKEIGNSLD